MPREKAAKQRKVLSISDSVPEDSVALLLQLRSYQREMMEMLEMETAHLIEKYLAGELDCGGHEVEVREKIIGGEIVRSLLVDGESA